MTKYNSFSSKDKIVQESQLPEKIESISVSYDGGRFDIFINGKSFYENMCAGIDFEVEIQ